MSSHPTPDELAKQLNCPDGESGLKVSKQMYQSNQNMISESINSLQLLNDQSVLEIGHGNCEHLESLLSKATKIKYFGLEISKAMQQEARRINQNLTVCKEATFLHYNGRNIPFGPNFFDQILTINTIYFWQKPVEFLLELSKVLKPFGRIVITFIIKESMESLPFVKENFRLFRLVDLKKLVMKTDLILDSHSQIKETAESKDGSMVERHFIIAVLKKNSFRLDQPSSTLANI